MRRILAIAVTAGIVITAAVMVRLGVPSPGQGARQPVRPVGTARTPGTVPVGHARTRDGAVVAATDYTTLLAGPLILEPERYRRAERAIAAPSAGDRIAADGEQTIAAVEESTHASAEAGRGTRVVVRYVPIAYRVAVYDGSGATISVWGLWLVAERDTLPPTQTWSTTALTLEWARGDWKLTSSTTSPGPTPQLGQPAVASPALPPQLTDFEEYAHASG